jgi:dienelactone hydrolase
MPIFRRAVLSACAGLFLAAGAAHAATPPGQPKSGPGGAENPGVEIVKRAAGTASTGAYVFYSAGNPAQARPVVVLLHAWGAINPVVYGGWIDHLARRGYLVVFPVFQDIGRTRPVDATARVTKTLQAVLPGLASDPAAKADLTRVAMLGHSAGAGLAFNLAATAKSADLPQPKLVFTLMAGGIASDEKSRGIQLSDLSQIDPATSIVTMVGDREAIASERVSRRLLRETDAVPPEHKLFVRVWSDDHGFPALSATLASPGSPLEGYDSAALRIPPDPPRDPKAPREPQPRWSADMVLSGEQTVLITQLSRNVTDTLDYLAFWRSFDMAADAAFGGKDVSALRTESVFVDMGRWSDTWPVRRLAAEMPKPTPPASAAKPAAAPVQSNVIKGPASRGRQQQQQHHRR